MQDNIAIGMENVAGLNFLRRQAVCLIYVCPLS